MKVPQYENTRNMYKGQSGPQQGCPVTCMPINKYIL